MSRAFCTICSECYTYTDEIYSITCGHVFHLKCINEWISRSTTCPECRRTCTHTQKIYLGFDDSTAVSKNVTEIKSQLEQTIQNASTLEYQLEQSERDFSQLSIKYTTVDDKLKEANLRLQQFFILKSAVDDELKEANNKIQNLNIQMENRTKEIETLKATMRQSEADILKNERIRVVEKLKQVTLELEQDIVNSTELQNMLAPSTSSSSLQETMPINMRPSESARTPTKNDQINKSCNKNQNKLFDAEPIIEGPQQIAHGVIIKNLTVKDIAASFTDTVLKLSEAMGLHYTADDIERVFLLNEKLSLVVVFKTHHLKMRFLANKSKLRNNPFTKNLYVLDFNSLSHYAQILKTIGYEEVYIQNRQVFARIDSTFAPIAINSTEQVDEMIRASKTLAAIAPKQ